MPNKAGVGVVVFTKEPARSPAVARAVIYIVAQDPMTQRRLLSSMALCVNGAQKSNGNRKKKINNLVISPSLYDNGPSFGGLPHIPQIHDRNVTSPRTARPCNMSINIMFGFDVLSQSLELIYDSSGNVI